MTEELKLHERNCITLGTGTGFHSLGIGEIFENLEKLHGWELVEDHGMNKIVKKYKFSNFKEALEFTNKIGEIAESQNHHPDIKLGWGYVEMRIYTHRINGLSMNDFIIAAKIDKMLETFGI